MYHLRIATITLSALLTLGAGAVTQIPHPRSSELRTALPGSEQALPEPPPPEARPQSTLPTAPLGYEGNEHRDGIHHGYDGHHNWHLKGSRR